MRSIMPVLVVLAGFGLLPGQMAKAQVVATASYERGPRFLLATDSKLVPVEVSKTPVLARRLNLDLAGATLKEALAEIQSQSGLRLAYSDDAMPLEKRVQLRADAITAAAALTDVLFDVGVDVVFRADGSASLVKRPPAPPTGSIVGLATNAQSKEPIEGVEVFLQGTRWRTLTGIDGQYRLADVDTGTYVVAARRIGYTSQTQVVTVKEGQETSADIVLRPVPTPLEEVVVTGTVAETEVKALPNAITIITADDIERKNVQHVDELFRGEVPSIVAWDMGPENYYSDFGSIRGSSTIGSFNSLKIYIDGIEMSEGRYLSNLDPSMIERIEVIRGPQASTLYGSQALNGVMQIFTKKGQSTLRRPQVDMKVSGGYVESQWADPVFTQDHSLGISGGGENATYNFGGSFVRTGPYVPYYKDQAGGAFGSMRIVQGLFTAELSGRYSLKHFDWPNNPLTAPSVVGYGTTTSRNERDIIRQQTYGANVTYAATPWWQHVVRVGVDRHLYTFYNTRPVLRTPTDTLLVYKAEESIRTSVAYNSIIALSAGPSVGGTLTLGIDHWGYRNEGFFAGDLPRTAGVLSPVQGTPFLWTFPGTNTGFFGNLQVGFRDAIFLTAGLRGERNSTFGTDFGTAWSPRVGLSVVREVGAVAIKARASYGRATRPAQFGQAEESFSFGTHYLANPQLGPEVQKGVEAGMELYLGRRATLQATYYNQQADDLIDAVLQRVISIDEQEVRYENVGRIRNSGLELQASLNVMGPFTITGTYSLTRSKVDRLSPTYTGDYQPGDRLLGVPTSSAGLTVTYSHGGTTVSGAMSHFGSWQQRDWVAFYRSDLLGGPEPFRGSFRAYWMEYPSVTRFSVNVARTLTEHVSAFAKISNLTNKQTGERNNIHTTAGRTTMLGVRLVY